MGVSVFGTQPANSAGEYFGTSWWCWRPIHSLITEANGRFKLGLDLFGFDFNDGFGLHDQSACDLLASALEVLIAENPRERYTLDTEPNGPERWLMRFLVKVGWQVAPLDDPPYEVSLDRLRDFVAFLRSCGGFVIL
jgi:hypothetical protein